MITNQNRIGRPTSSQMGLLAVKGSGRYHFGEGAITYAGQKKAELRYGRSVDTGAIAQAMTWGKVMEKFVFADEEKIGFEWSLESLGTLIHPIYKNWAGSPDLIAEIKVGEIKCFYLERHNRLYDILVNNDIERLKKEFPDIYWQVVSNACVTEKDIAEVIAYCPTLSELLHYREIIENTNFVEKYMEDDAWPYRFLYENKIERLPWIPDDKKKFSLAKMEFEVKQSDQDFLADRVYFFNKLIRE